MTNEEISVVQARLRIYRRRMAILLQQYASFDKRSVPTHIVLEIEEIREQIKNIVDYLKSHNVAVENNIEDKGVEYFKDTAYCGTNWYSNSSVQSSCAIPDWNRVELLVVTAL
jgi:hypothetical protein